MCTLILSSLSNDPQGWEPTCEVPPRGFSNPNTYSRIRAKAVCAKQKSMIARTWFSVLVKPKSLPSTSRFRPKVISYDEKVGWTCVVQALLLLSWLSFSTDHDGHGQTPTPLTCNPRFTLRPIDIKRHCVIEHPHHPRHVRVTYIPSISIRIMLQEKHAPSPRLLKNTPQLQPIPARKSVNCTCVWIIDA